jgi:D-alanine-D-alanine ligase
MSIGVDETSVRTVDDSFDGFVDRRLQDFAQPLVVQDFVSGGEVGVPLIRVGTTHALPALEVRLADESVGLAARVQTFGERTRRAYQHVRYEASQTEAAELARTAVLAFDAIGMSGVGRMDFRVDADGRAWLFDTNEAPPPIAGTAFATAMDQLGFPLSRMLAVWLGVGLLDAGLISGV